MSPSKNGHEAGLGFTHPSHTGPKLPLEESHLFEGFSIVLTHGISAEGDLFAERLRHSGAEVLACPCIEILPPKDPSSLDAVVRHLEEYDWILFTSKNAVEAVATHLTPGRWPDCCQIAAVGPASKGRLEEYGLSVILVPEEATGKGLAKALMDRGEVSGRRFLFPASEIAREELPALLEQAGGQVNRVTAYRTVTYRRNWPCLEQLLLTSPSAVCFSSPSTARGFLEKLGEMEFRRITNNAVSFSTGKTTTTALNELGVERIHQADSPSLDSLFEALRSHFVQTR